MRFIVTYSESLNEFLDARLKDTGTRFHRADPTGDGQEARTDHHAVAWIFLESIPPRRNFRGARCLESEASFISLCLPSGPVAVMEHRRKAARRHLNVPSKAFRELRLRGLA